VAKQWSAGARNVQESLRTVYTAIAEHSRTGSNGTMRPNCAKDQQYGI